MNPSSIQAKYSTARKLILEGEKKYKQSDKKNDVPSPTNPSHHYLFGNAYDLRPFYNSHPGGSDILRMTAGFVDATPLFESYHAFADRNMILKQMESYRVEVVGKEGEPTAPLQIYSFEPNGFYRTVTRRVRHYFVHLNGGTANDEEVSKQSVPNNDDDGVVEEKKEDSSMEDEQHLNLNSHFQGSLTNRIKANWVWWAKVFAQLLLNIYFYYQAFLQPAAMEPTLRIFYAFLSGTFMFQIAFIAMHDASHFAIRNHNHWINKFVTRVWCSFCLWNARIWILHHVCRHHAYTGSEKLDPDIRHAVPFIRKHPETRKAKVVNLFQVIGDKIGMLGWGTCAFIFYVILPGLWGGQCLQYALWKHGITKESRYLWGMGAYSKYRGYESSWWEYVLFYSQLWVQWNGGSVWLTMAYFVGLNLTYSMCIVGDHDLVESAIINHVDVDINEPKAEKRRDWGEVQVLNTSNFVNDKYNIFAHFHGGINFQIEHHLFPGVCHVHYPAIAPIVQATCKEFGIEYVACPNLVDVWYSHLVVLKAVMTKEGREQEKKIK